MLLVLIIVLLLILINNRRNYLRLQEASELQILVTNFITIAPQ